MKQYRTVILGSGHFAAGYCSVLKDTLIVERTYLADAEASATLSGYRTDLSSDLSDEAKELHGFYTESKMANGNKLDSPILEVGLSAYAKRRGIKFLFGTECTEIKESDGGYLLTLFGNAGFETVFASGVIDNRRNAGNTLRVLVRAKKEAAGKLKFDCAEVEMTDAFYDEDCIISFKFPENTNINAAKTLIMRELQTQLPDGGCIIQMANLMTDKDTDPIRRFNEGVLLAKEETV